MDAADRGVRIIVTGRVQGVGYRYFARAQAVSLGVCGHVRNLGDGTVEAVAVGPAASVARFVDRLREGPSGASVHACRAVPVELAEAYTDFRITC